MEKMGKYIVFSLGVLCAVYGLLILSIGSGTGFWMLWEVLGVFFGIWGFLCHKNFFVLHKRTGMIFHMLVVVAVMILSVFCVIIAGKFRARGKENLDYVIVLGAQVREDGPSAVLKYRLDAALEYLNKNPNTICIVSGGKGKNEPFSEAEGMAGYLVQNGVDKERIILEDRSLNTVQNIQNSKELMKESYQGVGIITNNFHMFRALQLAKSQGLEDVCGIATKSNWLYLPNNVLRECCGILKDWLVKNI